VTRPLVEYFVTREMGLAKIYQYTKFDVSSFTRSRFTHFTEEGLKFKILAMDSDHAPFGGSLSWMRWDLPRSIRSPNLKFLASHVPNSGKGF